MAAPFSIQVSQRYGDAISNLSQKKAAAALIVQLTKEEDFILLMHHFGVVRTALNYITKESVSAVVRFFECFVMSGASAQHAVRQSLDAVHAENMASCEVLFGKLHCLFSNFFDHSNKLPALSSVLRKIAFDPPQRLPTSRPQSYDVPSLVSEAILEMNRFNCEFLSAVIAGCISVSQLCDYDLEGFTMHDFDDYFGSATAEELNDVRDFDFSSAENSRSGNSLSTPQPVSTRSLETPNPLGMSTAAEYFESAVPKSEQVSAVAAEGGPSQNRKGVSTCGGTRFNRLRREGRIVIVTTDVHQAKLLLVICAFFFKRGRVVTLEHDTCDEHPQFPCCVAGSARTVEFPSLPIQWVAEEWNRDIHAPKLCSSLNTEDCLLIIAPRSLMCRRLTFTKKFSTGDIAVERVGDKLIQPKSRNPFFCRVVEEETMVPNATIQGLVAALVGVENSRRRGKEADSARFGGSALRMVDHLEEAIEVFFHQARTYEVLLAINYERFAFERALRRAAAEAKVGSRSFQQEIESEIGYDATPSHLQLLQYL
jgi:hypothetical protein